MSADYGRRADDDWFGTVMLLLGMGVGTVIYAATGRYGLALAVGLLVTFSPLLLIFGLLAVDALHDAVTGRRRR